jgi:hypothetical protein
LGTTSASPTRAESNGDDHLTVRANEGNELACPRDAQGGCSGRLETRLAAGGLLAARRYRVPAAGRRVVGLALSPSEARRVRASRQIQLAARETDPQGRAKTTLATRRPAT